MPTYALLGATGATGSAILRCLLSLPPAKTTLNILVRSRAKLLKAFPNLENDPALQVRIVEGTATSTATLQRCLEDAEAIFMCVAQNESRRGVSLAHDTAAAIICALKTIRKLQGSVYAPPTVLQIRSASLNPKLSCQVPAFVYRIVSFCLHYQHVDTLRACELYESAAREDALLNYIFVDPPTVHDASGTLRSGYQLISTEKQETALSYADLGAAFCELAQRSHEYRGQAVGVTATGGVKTTWSVLAGYLVDGAKGRVEGFMAEGPAMPTSTSLFFFCGM